MVKQSFPWHMDVNNFVSGRSIEDKDIQALMPSTLIRCASVCFLFTIALHECVVVNRERLFYQFC